MDQVRLYEEGKAQNISLWGGKREVKLTRNIIKRLPINSGKLFDVGCGDGYLLHTIMEKGMDFRLSALDISHTRLQHTQKNVPGVQLVQGEIDHLPISDEYFDIVICSETLEHVHNYEESISEIFRVAKKGKYVFITVPNREVLFKDVCPHCNKSFYRSGHIRSFDREGLMKSVSPYGRIVACMETGSRSKIEYWGKRISKKDHKEPYLFCIVQKEG